MKLQETLQNRLLREIILLYHNGQGPLAGVVEHRFAPHLQDRCNLAGTIRREAAITDIGQLPTKKGHIFRNEDERV